MNNTQELRIILAENDPAVIKAINEILKDRGYLSIMVSTKKLLLQHLNEKLCHLTLIGELEDSDSILKTMREVVLASPLTATILMTDIPANEVHDKTEGYGILGDIGRTHASKELLHLLDQFEKIQGL